MERVDERGRHTDGEHAVEETGGVSARWADAALVAAMRRNEAGAFREFFARFAPLITALARSRPSASSELSERVTDFLDDAALNLCRATTPVPRTLAAWLAAAFRRRDHNRMRDLRVRERLREEYAADAGAASERVVVTASSENALRESHGPGWDGAALSPAMEQLALALEQGLSAEERQMLAWLGARVPQREIAAWLGTTHGATRVRITRLRARLRDAALRYAHRLDGPDRDELGRFFRRVEIAMPALAGPPARGAGTRSDSHLAVEEHDP